MTAPGGIPGFGYTDTSVAAKLSLDIPTDSVDILKNVAMYTGEIQASMEAAARFGGDFMNYLQQFPQIQREVLDMQKQTLQVLRDSTAAMDQMRNSSAGMTSMGGFSPQGGNTSQYFNAFSQMSGQQGSDRNSSVRVAPQDTSNQQDPSTRDSVVSNYVQTMGAPVGYFGPISNHAAHEQNIPTHLRQRMGLPFIPGMSNPNSQNDISASSRQQSEDREDSIDRQRAIRDRSTNPTARIASGMARRRMASAGHRRGTAPEEDEDTSGGNAAPIGDPSAGESDRNTPNPTPEEGEKKKGGLMRIANLLSNTFQGGLNTLGPDGTPIAGRLSLAGRVVSGIGELSPGVKAIGAAGLGIGAGALAFNAVQNVGETLQGYKNMDQHGNSVGGGMQIQKDVMLMSINPLISTEQSRSIIMGALKSGYTGDTYTNAVDFIKDNLVNMNMEVSKSVDLLRNNVELGRQSISGLKLDLTTMQGLASNGQKTNEQAQDQFTKTSDYLTQTLGVNGTAAGGFGNMVVATFNNKIGTEPNPLGESAQAISTGFLSNQSFDAQLKNGYSPGSMLQNVVKDLSESDSTGVKLSNAMWGVVAKLAKSVTSSARSDEDNKALFFQLLGQYNSYFADSTKKGEADSLYDQVMGSKGGAAITKAATDNINKAIDTKVGGVDASGLITFKEYQAIPGNEKKTSAQYEKDVLKGNTAVDAPAIRTLATSVGNDVVIDPKTGKTEAFDANNAEQKKAIDDGTLLKHGVSSMIAIDPDGTAHVLDATDTQQQIGLANGTWKLQGINKDLGIQYNSKGAPVGNSSDIPGRGAAAINTYINSKNFLANDLVGGTSSTLQEYISGGGNPSAIAALVAKDKTAATVTANGNSVSTSNNGTINISIGVDQATAQWMKINGVTPGSVPNSVNNSQATTGYGQVTTNSAQPGTAGRRIPGGG